MMTTKTNQDDRIQTSESNRLLRINQVLNLVPVGRSTWWAGVKTGRFPTPVKLGQRATFWKERDIVELIAQAGGAK